jgi:hypothetical protein
LTDEPVSLSAEHLETLMLAAEDLYKLAMFNQVDGDPIMASASLWALSEAIIAAEQVLASVDPTS